MSCPFKNRGAAEAHVPAIKQTLNDPRPATPNSKSAIQDSASDKFTKSSLQRPHGRPATRNGLFGKAKRGVSDCETGRFAGPNGQECLRTDRQAVTQTGASSMFSLQNRRKKSAITPCCVKPYGPQGV